MRTTAIIFAAAVTLAPFGCAELSKAMDDAAKQAAAVANESTAPAPPAASAPAPATPPPPSGRVAPRTTGKAEFEGWYLTVWLDGKKTRPTPQKDLGERVWIVADISRNPVVKVQFDAGHLGDFRTADVVINPIKAGKTDPNDLWHHPAVRTALKPGQPLKLTSFNHIAGGKLTAHTALPPGQYSIKVSINGTHTWDRQVVHVTVK